MPNGKPGDHPITDILVHKENILGKGIDELIREIYAHPGFKKFDEEITVLIVNNEPPWNKKPDYDRILTRLLEIKKELGIK